MANADVWSAGDLAFAMALMFAVGFAGVSFALRRSRLRQEKQWQEHWEMLFKLLRKDISGKLSSLRFMASLQERENNIDERFHRIARWARAKTAASTIGQANNEVLEHLERYKHVTEPELSRVVIAYSERCLNLRTAVANTERAAWGEVSQNLRGLDEIVAKLAARLGARYQPEDGELWLEVGRAMDALWSDREAEEAEQAAEIEQEWQLEEQERQEMEEWAREIEAEQAEEDTKH